MKTVIIVLLIIVLSIIFICSFGPDNFPFYSIYSTKMVEYEKQQWVRLLDIIVLGPIAIWLGYQLESDKTKSWGIVPYLLYSYAFGTIVYNFINYYKNIYN